MTFREIMKRLGFWNSVQRQTYRELAQMSDKDLWDIGLTRVDILRLVEEAGNEEEDKNGR